MEHTQRCQGCAAENPAGAAFCIECGAALAAASTGPTVKLSGKVCWSCGEVCPNGAEFCTRCGTAIQSQPAPRPSGPALRPQQPAPPRWTPPPTPPWSQPRRHLHPRIHTSPAPAHIPRTPPPRPLQSNQGLILLMALVGLVMLGVAHSVWPAMILIMLGVALLSERRGRPVFTMNGLLFMVCMLVAFSTGFWPIFLLFFLLRNR